MKFRSLRHLFFAAFLFTAGALLMGQAATPTSAPATQKENRFEKTIQKFEEQDKHTPPPQHAILFIGSSTFTRWKDIQNDFPGLTVFNRAFGGSTMADVNWFADRIVLPYKPARIVVYEGTNDIAGGKSAEKVVGEMKVFHQKVHAALPDTQIYFLSAIPSPSRTKVADEMDHANAMLREYVAQHPELHYIDARYVWSDANRQPDEKLYVKDRLHPSREGYEKLIPIIRAAIDPAASQPAKK